MSQHFDPEGPEALFVQADALIEAGDTIAATETLSRLISNYPGFGRAYNHLGYIWETKFRDLRKAEEYYKSCLNYSPEYPAIYYNYAVLLSTQARFEELESLLKKALEVPGINKSKIYNEFGIMYEVQGRYSEALASYRQGIRFSFSQKDINTYRTSIQRTEEKKKFFDQGEEGDRDLKGNAGDLPLDWN